MEKNVIQINGGIMISVDVSLKKIYVKKIMFGILLHVVVKMENIQQALWMIQQLHMMKLYCHLKKKQELFQQILMKTKKFLYFTCIFINYYSIIHICQYLLYHLLPFQFTNIKTDEKSYKNILIYYIGYVTIKDLKYVKINSVNTLYLIFGIVNGYFEEINGNDYFLLVPTYESKEIVK